MTTLEKRNHSAIASALIKAGFSSEFAEGFDEVLTSEDLEFMLDELLFENEQPDLVEDFLGAPLDVFDERNVDDLILDLQSHPLVQGNKIKNEQDELLSEMKPGMLDKDQRKDHQKALDKLSKDQDKNFENTDLVLIYRTQQDGRVDDLHCLPLEGDVYLKSDPNRPRIPRDLHPGCRCYWEDAVTAENLGQF